MKGIENIGVGLNNTRDATNDVLKNIANFKLIPEQNPVYNQRHPYNPLQSISNAINNLNYKILITNNNAYIYK